MVDYVAQENQEPRNKTFVSSREPRSSRRKEPKNFNVDMRSICFCKEGSVQDVFGNKIVVTVLYSIATP